MENALENTTLAHHEQGNTYCRYCNRMDADYPRPCPCGGLIHGEIDETIGDNTEYIEVCDGCGPAREEAVCR